MNTNHHQTRPSLVFAALLVAASLLPNFASASSATSYPLLPDLPGPDIEGEAQIVIYLDHDIPLVEVDGHRYALDGRPLEVAVGDLDYITLLFVVPRASGVFVTEDGLWTQELDPSFASRMLAFDMFGSSISRAVPDEFGFEIALPGQPAPTVPDLVIRPTDPDPD